MDINYPKVYACATLWHENENEMKSLLTSILKKKLILNDFVKNWCKIVAETLKNDQNNSCRPKKYYTPYGGRLEWQLEGGNLLNVHLKNKQEVRHKKRWSQVMHMFYVLNYKLKKECGQNLKTLNQRLAVTYLLTLDGDVDFQPNAVLNLIDSMKRNKHIGSVCGRIHPLGSGPIIWYQKFEYAIAHWLQKSSEHVFGCVLCSPGCFALFRGTAVAEAIETYANESESAMDFLQHDQGEDRWLCTLLLKNGWQIEYCAISDAKTYAPEELSTFFNQRKRWIASTLTSHFDLLRSFKAFVGKHRKISFGFILYLALGVLWSTLATGIGFLILLVSLATTFGFDYDISLIVNLNIVIVYSLICLYSSEKFQLKITTFLSIIYALIMVTMLIFILNGCLAQGATSPNSFFLAATFIFFVSIGVLHPYELYCLSYCLVYFAAIPCSYVLLSIYTICNCHKVNWGTREVSVQKRRTKSKCDNVPFEWVISKDCSQLPVEEEIFWKDLVDKILFALPYDKRKNDDFGSKLLTLRDKSVLVFFCINIVYIFVILLLQYYKSIFSINWPFANCVLDSTENMSLVKECNLHIPSEQCCKNVIMTSVDINNTLAICQSTYLIDQLCRCVKVEPINIAIVLSFQLVLIVQLVGLLVHRFQTVFKIISSTDKNHKEMACSKSGFNLHINSD